MLTWNWWLRYRAEHALRVARCTLHVVAGSLWLVRHRALGEVLALEIAVREALPGTRPKVLATITGGGAEAL